MADKDSKTAEKPAEKKAAKKAIEVQPYVGANPNTEPLTQEQYEELKRKTAEQDAKK